MRLFCKCKDGGPESPVDAYFLFEFKGLFSVALLKFNKGGREAYHTHAFNAWTWFICGEMREQTYKSACNYVYSKDLLPKYTPREKNHRVLAVKDSWAFTIRGPWLDVWTETSDGVEVKLTHGRKLV